MQPDWFVHQEKNSTQSAASIPSEAMIHFPLFQIFPPSISENLLDSVENFPNFTFSQRIFRFSTAKIYDDLFYFSPIFAVSVHFLHYFGKIIISPYFFKVSPDFVKFTCFLHTLFFVSPTFTLMHLCITQCTYWTPMDRHSGSTVNLNRKMLKALLNPSAISLRPLRSLDRHDLCPASEDFYGSDTSLCNHWPFALEPTPSFYSIHFINW